MTMTMMLVMITMMMMMMVVLLVVTFATGPATQSSAVSAPVCFTFIFFIIVVIDHHHYHSDFPFQSPKSILRPLCKTSHMFLGREPSLARNTSNTVQYCTEIFYTIIKSVSQRCYHRKPMCGRSTLVVDQLRPIHQIALAFKIKFPTHQTKVALETRQQTNASKSCRNVCLTMGRMKQMKN